jgi:hypothetical protein
MHKIADGSVSANAREIKKGSRKNKRDSGREVERVVAKGGEIKRTENNHTKESVNKCGRD